jgi:toxin ParE1/3/4
VKVEFHPAASDEVGDSAAHYEGMIDGLGSRFIEEVERASELLERYPEIGQQIDFDIRQFVLADFPHSLIYALEPELVWVLAVAHHKRRPGYWKSRVE